MAFFGRRTPFHPIITHPLITSGAGSVYLQKKSLLVSSIGNRIGSRQVYLYRREDIKNIFRDNFLEIPIII